MPLTADERSRLDNLIAHIEQNLRAGARSGLHYIDPRDFKRRFASPQNHVVFGRRGAGKSMLVETLRKDPIVKGVTVISLNLEDYKDISFPNIIIKVLVESLKALRSSVEAQKRWWHPLRRRRILKVVDAIGGYIVTLDHLIDEPDEFSQKETTRAARKDGGGMVLTTSDRAPIGVKISDTEELDRSQERAREVSINKLDHLRKNLTKYKDLLNLVSKEFGDGHIFLVLDDFYFLPKTIQPDFIDYFHRLTKDSSLYIKVATIKHRTNLFKKQAGSFVGTELNHDIFPIDLDYTLDSFQQLLEFMKQIVENLYRQFDSPTSDKLFAGDGFPQLCLASGGVPRDFLTLFSVLLRRLNNGDIEKIGKVEVTDAAITNFASKMEALRTDSAEEGDDLELYLNSIKGYVISEKRTNTFLVAKQELEAFPTEKQALRELVDLRFFHVVDSNISAAPSDGRQYEAYLVDVGMYPNTRPRNFNQIDPTEEDENSRRDQLRASPRVDLKQLNADIGHQVKALQFTS